MRPIRARQSRSAPALPELLECRRLLSTTPNDPSYPSQSNLSAINASGAWDVSTGSASVVVGHLDTGIDYTHPDLYLNIWINQAEIPKAVKKKLKDTDGDGVISFYDLNDAGNAGRVADGNANGYIDAGDLLVAYKKNGTGGWEDRKNGKSNAADSYVDDIIGWDFADNDNDPLDTDGHGTHTAGVIGAVGNNGVGIAGVAWKVSMMAIKVFGDGAESADDAAIAAGIVYAADNGVRVANNSYGGSGALDAVIRNAIDYAGTKDMLLVFAAGNDGVNNDASRFRSYPATYDQSNVISVAATDADGTLASYSNYGSTSVDIAAPGTDIYSTWLDGTYQKLSGTSMAAPHVTGAIALMLSADPTLTGQAIKERLINGAVKRSALTGTSVSGGRLDVYNAVTNTVGITVEPPDDATAADPVTTPTPTPTPTLIPAPTDPATPTVPTLPGFPWFFRGPIWVWTSSPAGEQVVTINDLSAGVLEAQFAAAGRFR